MGKHQAQLNFRVAEDQGWRSGRPIEDPEKTKRWGFVTAKPSEFLVHVRRGRVLENSSGQGASCFKWPWDAVAIIPTSLQRLQFRADQVTAEKVGVEVVGLAVYRIAEPLLAYRVLNFSFPERAQEKLEETLTAMFVGATRRLVANLSVAECLQKRKIALADELIREIAPVVGGQGRPTDVTDRGWGVVLDTIEVQEVKILSERVFASLQAPFRAEIDQRARKAKAEAESEVTTREAELGQRSQEAKIRAEAAVRERKAEAARIAREEEAKDALRTVEIERRREEARRSGQQALAEQQIALELALITQRLESEQAQAELAAAAVVKQAERTAREAEAVLSIQALELERRAHQAELRRADAAIEAELARIAAETRRAAGEVDLDLARKTAEIDRIGAEAKAKLVVAERLPDLAAAIGQRIQEVRVHQIGGEPLGMITQAVRGLLSLANE